MVGQPERIEVWVVMLFLLLVHGTRVPWPGGENRAGHIVGRFVDSVGLLPGQIVDREGLPALRAARIGGIGRFVGRIAGRCVDPVDVIRAICLVRPGAKRARVPSMPGDDRKTPAAAGPEPVYTIRAAPGRQVSCASCGRSFAGYSPVGCSDDEPVCDLCLLEGDNELGMVLALVSVVRAYATVAGAVAETRLEPLLELDLFARVYERFAAKIGPPRIFPVTGASKKEPAAAAAPPEAE